MITGGDLRQSRLDVGYKTFTISPWVVASAVTIKVLTFINSQDLSSLFGLLSRLRGGGSSGNK